MKSNKTALAAAAFVVAIVGVAGMVIIQRQAAEKTELQARKQQQQPLARKAPEPATLQPANPAPEIAPAPETPRPEPQPPLPAAKPAAANPPGAPADKITAELARAALSEVGADPDAEAYWAAAINNPELPPDERQNLIEDLNEDGLSDPKHPGPQDLPLILNRLQLIEEMAPSSMDQVNADAFMEAYKDLVNLAQLASGAGGEDVK